MKALLDVKGAAEALAVSTWTIRAYIRDGKLQPVRIGRLVRFEERELERFVSNAGGKREISSLDDYSIAQPQVVNETEDECQ